MKSKTNHKAGRRYCFSGSTCTYVRGLISATEQRKFWGDAVGLTTTERRRFGRLIDLSGWTGW